MDNTENNVQLEQKNEEVTTSSNEIGTKIKNLINQHEIERSQKLEQVMNYEKTIESLKKISEKKDDDFMIEGVLPEGYLLNNPKRLTKWFDLKEQIESGELDTEKMTEEYMYDDWNRNWVDMTVDSDFIYDINIWDYIDQRDFIYDNFHSDNDELENIKEGFFEENYFSVPEKEILSKVLNEKCY